MKRATRLLAAFAVLALVAAACASKDDAGKPAADTCATDKFGCVTYKAGEPIKVGELLSISGNTAFLGKDTQTGVLIAIDYLDGKIDGVPGKLLDRAISVVAEDDLCSKAGGQSGGTKLAADPTIVGVIGTTCSSSALGVADKILSDKGILLISSSNTNPNLTAQGTHQPFYFRTAHNDKIQGAVVSDFTTKNLKAKTAATIHDESPYADALAAVFRTNFEKAGGKITANEAINSADKDFKPLLTTIGQGKPDVLYFPNFNPACALIAKQAKGIAGLEKTSLIGSDGCLDPTYLQVGGAAVNGSYASGPDFAALKSGDFYANQFLPEYKKRAGTDPTAAFHAHAYDAANALFDAIKKTAVKDGDTIKIARTALKDALVAVSGVKGLSGEITCTALGDCATAVKIGVYKVPDWPVEGGTKGAEAVLSETKTLAEV